MDGINERQMQIITELNQKGFVRGMELGEKLGVSAVTIRKDLSFLEKKGLLFRTHGGASLQSLYAFERNVQEKEQVQVEQKRSIASKALAYINHHDYLIFASGTTIHYLSRMLGAFEKLTVLTSSLYVAVELSSNRDIDVIQLGGNVRKSSRSIVGPMAEQMLADYSCNTLFLGADGIDLDYGITTSNAQEASLNQRMIANAEKVILLADSSKIGKRSFGKIGTIQDVDVLITDAHLNKRDKKQLEDLGVDVVLA